MNTDRLIDNLIADATPVRRLRPLPQRIMACVGIAVTLAVAVILMHGLRPGLMDCMTEWQFLAGTIAPMVTGALAVVGALTAAQPDRSERWLLLPVPALLLWIGGATGGCLMDWAATDFSNVHLAGTLECVTTVGVGSLVLAGLLYVLLRPLLRAAPRGTIVVASLAAASIATAAHSLSHAIETSAVLLIWSPGVAAIVFGMDVLVCRLLRARGATIRPAWPPRLAAPPRRRADTACSE